MKHQIIPSPTYTNSVRIGWSLDPDDEVLRFFFSSFRILRYPLLLLNLRSNQGYLGDPQGVMFPHEAEEEDIAPNEVLIYHHVFGETSLSQELFRKMALKYGAALLTEYRDSPDLPDDWKSQMQQELEASEL